jgi:tetratricopeptide (TPR) repeat protein
MSKSAHELTRREMKGPDKFQVAAAEAAEWAVKRQKVIAAAAVALLLVAALVVGVMAWLDGRKAAAGGALYHAADVASGEISTVPLPGIDRPVFPTQEAKYRAQIAAAEQVRNEHGGTRAATTAALLEGNARLALKEWDAAAAAFQRYLSEAPATDEAKGDLAAAEKTWEQAAGIGFFKNRATLERARVLAKAGKKDEAKKALESIAKDAPLAPEAQEKLSRLGAAR